MTIAACYPSSEGVVLGADSTSTLSIMLPNGKQSPPHHLNFAQKVFEVGENGTMGVAIWGCGSLGFKSHRTFIAEFSDAVANTPPATMADAGNTLSSMLWQEYSAAFHHPIAECRSLLFIPEANRTPEQVERLSFLMTNLTLGYCLGGRTGTSRNCEAYQILLRPDQVAAPPTQQLRYGQSSFWGCPNFVERILFGCSNELFGAVLASGKWTGTQAELQQIFVSQKIGQPTDLPLREAIDWVNTAISTTIKAMKFSHHLPVCGGPIEIAVVTSDRGFRWAKHKSLTAALD